MRKEQWKKRCLAGLICAAMVFQSLPISALAGEPYMESEEALGEENLNEEASNEETTGGETPDDGAGSTSDKENAQANAAAPEEGRNEEAAAQGEETNEEAPAQGEETNGETSGTEDEDAAQEESRKRKLQRLTRRTLRKPRPRLRCRLRMR